MTERWLVRFEDGVERCYTTRDIACIACGPNDEMIYMTDCCPELYRYAKFIPKITHEIEGLMAEVDDLRVKNGSSPKYGTMESV